MNTAGATASAALMPGVMVSRYATGADAAAQLAGAVATDLGAALAERGHASLAVSGGTTPAKFLRTLGALPLDWTRISVILTDERWVPPGHPRANATMLAATLLAGRARACTWQPLYVAGLDRRAGLSALNQELRSFGWPLDVAVLGMGNDGHVASLFPGDTWNSADSAHVIAASSPGGEQRVSLTLDTLRAARHRYLLIHGAAKAALLGAAADADLPISALIAGATPPVHAFVAEESSS